jgi:hypothetical protein
LTVTDSTGGTDSTTLPITIGSTPPQLTISVTPDDGNPVSPGQLIAFEGFVTDTDETLPDSALEWKVLLHHNTHVHVRQESSGRVGSVMVEDHGVGAYSYEILLSVTDSSGLTASTSVSFPVSSLP